MKNPESPLPQCDLADRPQGSNSPDCPTCRGDLARCPWSQALSKEAEERKAQEADG